MARRGRGVVKLAARRQAIVRDRRNVKKRRKDGHDGWHGRPREKSRTGILSSAREEQAAVQWSTRPTPVRAQAVAGLLWTHLRYLHEAMEVSAAAQVSIIYKMMN